MTSPLLDIRQLSISYGTETVLEPFDWIVQKGERWAILGANGTGKTSVLQALLGLQQKQSSHIALDGRTLATLSANVQAKKRVWVPQRYDEPFTLTTLQAIESMAPETDVSVIEQILERFGLTHLANHWVHTLSGGERQRLTWVMSVARMTQDTALWLLDEPLAAQDLAWQSKLLQMLSTSQTAVIAAIHDLNQVTQYASHVLLIKKHNGAPSQVMAMGKIDDVMQADMLSEAYGVNLRLIKTEADSWWTFS